MKTILYTFLLMCSSVFAFAQIHVTPPNGDVGIGTTTPTGKLTVISSANKIGMESRSPHGNTHLPYSNGWSYISGKGVIFRTGNTERMRVSNNGNVGIGTANLGGRLTVLNPYGNTHLPFSDGSSYISGKNIILRANTTNGNTERMRIASNGNVGIGTTTPSQKLDVNGNVNVGGNVLYVGRKRTGNVWIAAGRDRTGSGWTILDLASKPNQNYGLRIGSHSSYSVIQHGSSSSGSLRLQTLGPKPIWFFTGGNSGDEIRMAVHESGRVGIGTTTPNVNTLLDVKGSIGFNGTYVNTSDKRLKTNAKAFDYGLEEVLTLSPIYYNYNGKAGTKTEQTHVGIYAQDLKKAAPKLVGEFTYQKIEITKVDDEGLEETEKLSEPETYLNINESAIKYMLINAVKEQQTIIEELQKEVSELRDIIENGSSPRTGNSRQNVELEGKEPALKQNSPNPFSSRTLIEYYVPADTKKAEVKIYDWNGKLMYNESIRGTGEGSIQVEARTIPTGTYNYSLVVDGKVIDTKQMVIVQ